MPSGGTSERSGEVSPLGLGMIKVSLRNEKRGEKQDYSVAEIDAKDDGAPVSSDGRVSGPAGRPLGRVGPFRGSGACDRDRAFLSDHRDAAGPGREPDP